MLLHRIGWLCLFIRDCGLCGSRCSLILDSIDGLQGLEPIRPMRQGLILLLVEDGFPIMLVRCCGITSARIPTALQVTPSLIMFDSVVIALSIRVHSDLFAHDVNIFLSLLYHLHSPFPLLLELLLSLLYILNLDLNPLFELLFLRSVGSRWELSRFVHLFDVFPFLFNSVVQGLLSYLDQVQEFIVFDHMLEFLCCVFLEWVSFKKRRMRWLCATRISMLLY